MTDDAELAAIMARDADAHNQLRLMAEPPEWDCVSTMRHDRRALLRMLNETRTILFHAQQAVLKEGLARDALAAELAQAIRHKSTAGAALQAEHERVTALETALVDSRRMIAALVKKAGGRVDINKFYLAYGQTATLTSQHDPLTDCMVFTVDSSHTETQGNGA